MQKLKKLEGIPRKTTSLTLDKYIHQAVRQYCFMKDIKIYQFFDEAISKHLKDCQKQDKKEGK